MRDLATFNTLAPAFLDDPYPVYAALQAEAPVFWAEAEQAWVLLRRQEVSEAFTNSSHLTIDLGQFVANVARALGDDPVELLRLLEMVLFFRNPPSHGPLRSLVARLLASRSHASCAAEVERIARQLITPLARDGGMDLMGDYAVPLPPLFMGWLFGLSNDESMWLSTTLSGVPVILNRGCSIRDYRRANLRLIDAHAFLRDRIAQRRRNPADDGLSLLISRNAEAETPIDDDRLTALTSFVFMAGFETTAALIGNSLWLLLDHPEELARAVADPTRIPGAVNEALRLEPPIQQVRRRAAADQTIAGHDIKMGQHMILMIAAANRDPAAYANPDLFLPDRAGPVVQSFGAGLHHCLGGWLGRMEAEIALGAVLAGPKPRPALEKPKWLPFHNQRRMSSLPVMI